MTKKITKLTDAQKARLPEWRDKWIEIGLRTGEADWERFDRGIRVAYEKAGIPFPEKIIRVPSPIVGAFATAAARRILGGDAVGGAVYDAVGGAVGDAVDDAVHGAVHDAVSGAIDDAVRGAVSDAVDGAVDDAVGDAVHGAVDGVVGGAVGRTVGRTVGDAVSGAVRTKGLSWHSWLGGQFWVCGWWGSPAFVSFFTEVCGLKLSQDIQERAAAYRDICESVNYIWPNRIFVMVCERPVAIRRNHEGQLSSDQKMAIEYPDGWGLYALDGVVFKKDLWEKVVSQTMTLTELFAIENADQRAVAVSYNGKAIIASGAEMIDSHPQHGDLYLLQNTEFNKYCGHKKAYFLRMDCPTGREFIEAVPPDVAEKTPYAMHCQAAAFGVPAEIFQGLLPQNAG